MVFKAGLQGACKDWSSKRAFKTGLQGACKIWNSTVLSLVFNQDKASSSKHAFECSLHCRVDNIKSYAKKVLEMLAVEVFSACPAYHTISNTNPLEMIELAIQKDYVSIFSLSGWKWCTRCFQTRPAFKPALL